MSKKALVIDDDEMALMCLKNFLKQEGYAFESAQNGNEGIEKLKSENFDLLFIDFHPKDITIIYTILFNLVIYSSNQLN